MNHRCWAAFLLLTASPAFAQNSDYRYYNGDPGGTHYSKLTQINPGNVGRLHEVWRYDLGGNSELENTPIAVDRANPFGCGAENQIGIQRALRKIKIG